MVEGGKNGGGSHNGGGWEKVGIDGSNSNGMKNVGSGGDSDCDAPTHGS